MFGSVVALLLIPLASASHEARSHDHAHVARQTLPGTWYHARDHPIHALFARDNTTFPAVGSAEWVAALPPFTPEGSQTPNISTLPSAWTDAYNAAVTAGNIPKITPSISGGVYPNNQDPNSPEICSSYVQCRMPEDHYNVTAGYLALNFDDGPTEFTAPLLDFLDSNNKVATHFLIGYSVQQNVAAFQLLLNSTQDLAVHTWSHPPLTTLTDLEVVSELGWSMYLLYISTGGRVPRFWRPPTGDSDNRVRAIAKYVFGLEMVVWNQDTEDWSLTTTAPLTTPAEIASNMTLWLTGSKALGLMILEHELSNASISAFMAAYPQMISNGWNLESAAVLADANGAWRNADGLTGPITPAGQLDFAGDGPFSENDVAGASVVVGSTAAGTGTGASSPAKTGTGSSGSSTGTSSTSTKSSTNGARRLESASFSALMLGVLAYVAL